MLHTKAYDTRTDQWFEEILAANNSAEIAQKH